MAANMKKLTPTQQDIANRIKAAGQQLGAPNAVIQAAINIANAESTFDPAQQNKTSSAKGLFQYIDRTWDSHWNRFVSNNPSNPLSQMSASVARTNVDAQIQVMYSDLNQWYAGYDQGKIAKNYLSGGNLYSVTQQLQANGIDINHDFLNYAYLRHNTDASQVTNIVNNVFTAENLAATQSMVGTIGQNLVAGKGINIPGDIADPGMHYFEISSSVQKGRLYDNGVLYTVDVQTGVQHWSIPTDTGGVRDITKLPNGQVSETQYNVLDGNSIQAVVTGQGAMVSLTNATINLANSSQAVVTGNGNAFTLASGANLTCTGTGESIAASAAYDNITLGNNSSANITGNSDSVNFGTGDTATVTGTNDLLYFVNVSGKFSINGSTGLTTVNGAGDAVRLNGTGGQVVMYGGYNTVDISGSGVSVDAFGDQLNLANMLAALQKVLLAGASGANDAAWRVAA